MLAIEAGTKNVVEASGFEKELFPELDSLFDKIPGKDKLKKIKDNKDDKDDSLGKYYAVAKLCDQLKSEHIFKDWMRDQSNKEQ